MGLVQAEILKISKRRVFWVMLIILLVLTAFTALIFLVAPRFAEDIPLRVEKPSAYLIGAQQVAGQTWFPLILAAMLLGGEVASTAWASALTRESRRARHLFARLSVTTAGSWLAMLLAVGAFSVAVAIIADGSGTLEGSEWFGIFWKTGLITLTWVAIGLAAAAWLRSVGPAIAAGLAFNFVDQLAALWAPYRRISFSINSAALLGPLDVINVGDILGDTPEFGQALAVVLAWTILAVVAAWAGLQYRDA
jgi:hypothetical protein